ncbi:DNA helicase RecQ [Heliobacterium gestii]|uniref:DNA helicase RecQ n=1 Tax=Heliomicrobium gestii TaxID=2699 RepID=A0A845LAW8_HELGE|nr:DNA helicase RecQ [Heliomicrobium gestii]MBM7867535.1 ATP-dependent DNA helicase RecQ [Heliomicrobium gestii]MZP43917.1 DNA helicase RecQ [Heliomicrobium gestii]
MLQQARTLLNRHYGYTAFRPGQEKIIESLLTGRDTVGIMPTGGGKSICYQIPALLLPGLTVVISPLIALMKDQVDNLQNLGIAATFINSSLDSEEVDSRVHRMNRGEFKLIYLAPERLESPHFRHLLQRLPVSLIAVDEAHCVSQWGHDFRPSYLSIASLVADYPRRPRVSAFTATATEAVTEDIIRHLGLQQPHVFATGFDRPNLSFRVIRGENKKDFLAQYLEANRTRAGIIYTATRKEADLLQEYLLRKGFRAGKYHAGLADSEREQAQEAFLYDDSRIMVATNAFGMGIDKSNVRFVIHYNMPKNMESYYQEAGRAGRDGEPAECILLFSARDINTQKFLIEQNQATPERKSMEHRKLQSMIDYCHTPRCLRSHILNYFGEEAPERCGNCSSCADDVEPVDITTEAQKIFSCIVRMQERFGMNLVAEVLKGSKSKKVAQSGCDRLSTYGIMREYTIKEITDMISILTAEGYLYVTEGAFPVVRLLEKAVPVLKGHEKVFLKVRKRASRLEADSDIFESLRRLRKEIADRDGVPPYIVFPDSTLREMSQRLPLDRASLRAISGVGDTKLDRYGDAFLEEIGRHIK